jgi:hypothetical protein
MSLVLLLLLEVESRLRFTPTLGTLGSLFLYFSEKGGRAGRADAGVVGTSGFVVLFGGDRVGTAEMRVDREGVCEPFCRLGETGERGDKGAVTTAAVESR